MRQLLIFVVLLLIVLAGCGQGIEFKARGNATVGIGVGGRT